MLRRRDIRSPQSCYIDASLPLGGFAVGGRDRSAARTTLGGEFPTLALSIREVGASCHHGPRFPRPPGAPGRWAFPRPVLPLAALGSPSPPARSSRAAPPPPRRFLGCCHGRC